jgi:hypothetical protein
LHQIARALLATAAAVLAGCQPLPQPFAPGEEQRNNALLEIPDSAGVLVLPVTGVGDTIAVTLSRSVAKALRAADVPAATSGGSTRTHVLQGWLESRPAGGGNIKIDIIWDLFDGEGTLTGSRPMSWQVAGFKWHGGDRFMLDRLARESAPEIAMLMRRAPPAKSAGRLLRIGAIAGAPGDGGTALKISLATALRRLQFTIADTSNSTALAVTGTFRAAPPQAGEQVVEIVWKVTRADGSEVGTLTQSNMVPAGSLDGRWGGLSDAIADAVAGGIGELLDRAESDRGTAAAPARR